MFFKRRPPEAEKPERLAPQAAYALWAATYPPRPHNTLMEAEHASMLDLLPHVTGLNALDAGCGTGRYLKVLRDRGAHALGVDQSEAMIRRARTVSIRVACADLRALPMRESSMDVVVSGLALGDVADLRAAVAELARVLKPGGRLVYSVVHPDGKAAGWLRTFEAGGRTWEVESHWHSRDEHGRACAAAGLEIEEHREPVVASADGGKTAAAFVLRAVRRR